MTALKVWEKYKHLDLILSPACRRGKDFRSRIIYDLWAAIKHTIQVGEGRK